MANLVLIDEAAEHSTLDKNYIRYLARKGFIVGQKRGRIWLVDLDSIKAYEQAMQEAGTKKFDPTKYRK